MRECARMEPEPCLFMDEECGGVLLCSPSCLEDAGLCSKMPIYYPETRPNLYGTTQRGEVWRIKTSSTINARSTGC